MQKDETINGEVKEKRNIVTSIIVGGVGAFSALYLLNPTGGFIELIPDFIPVVGALDEAAATAMLISCLAYFGVDIGSIFGRKKKDESSDIIDVEAQE